jgi:hypothetical protein
MMAPRYDSASKYSGQPRLAKKNFGLSSFLGKRTAWMRDPAVFRPVYVFGSLLTTADAYV